tara:strand:+ start:502 stop:765 length:264 start_codon:yes stop_codon:yes gene_type:complete
MSHKYPIDWKYGIVNSTDLSNIDFDQIHPVKATALRYCTDGTKFVIKWEIDHDPTFITDGTITPVSILSYGDCSILMQTEEWTNSII